MLSFMIAAIVFITVYINQTSKQDSVVINVAGKQRMLTQKITKEVLLLRNHVKPDFTTLDVSIKEFDTTLDDLIDGNSERDIYAPPRTCIKERLLQVESLWMTFETYLHDLEHHQVGPASLTLNVYATFRLVSITKNPVAHSAHGTFRAPI